jgi:5'(3')-deoxyribonucleotidase
MNNKVIAFDMDGVIVDFVKPWLEWYNKEYNDSLTEADLRMYEFGSQTKAGKKIYDFLRVPNNYDKVLEIPHMLALMQTYQNLGHRIIVATKASHNGNMVENKTKWFERNAPFLNKHDIVFVQNKELIRADVLIDDDPRNLEKFPGDKILFRHSYNNAYKLPKDWYECTDAESLSRVFDSLYGGIYLL